MKELIGKKIADARDQRGLKQSDLAEFLGLKSPQAVSEIERGKVNISAADLFRLSDFLNKPISYFFGEDFGSDELEDAFALIKQMPREEVRTVVEIAKTNTRMKNLVATLPAGDDLNPIEHRDFIQKFISEMLDIKRPVEAQLKSMEFIISQFEDLLKTSKEKE